MLLNIKFSNQDITEVAHFLFDVGAGWLSETPREQEIIVTNSNWFLHHDGKNNIPHNIHQPPTTQRHVGII